MNELQALVTGALIGSLATLDALAIDVEQRLDGEGNYLPEFFVIGRESGTRLLVRVEVVE